MGAKVGALSEICNYYLMIRDAIYWLIMGLALSLVDKRAYE